jgi:cellulose synthase/poly-beta-1,6-N-acetylglucosamine synthase-like glycosyltransferase
MCTGHKNVHYVGDRQRHPSQINGKSANINHVVTQKIYPAVTSPDDIPEKDILMVMDCDHMCKPNIFNKMGPCMRNLAVGITLAPQWFHNLILPGNLLSS